MARKARPKTGEARKTRQPFAIDKLPSEWRDQIIAWRAKWLTWEQLEEETRNFKWDELEKSDPELALAHFADRRIPHSTLHRWYDVQVEQKLEEIETERAKSLAIAEKLAGAGYEKLDESVKNAMADAVFTHAKDSGDPQKFAAALGDLALALTRFKRTEIAKQRVELESKKLEDIISRGKKETDDAAAKLDKGKPLTIADINRIRERALGLPPVERPAGSPTA